MTRANAVPDSTAGPQASEGGGVRYRLSAVFPFLVLGLIVIASALQTEVAHNLTTNIGYNQPYFTFFVTHITFSFIFPLHLLYLHFTDRATPTTTYLDRIRTTIAVQLNLHAVSSASWKQISRPWCAKIAWLTVLISLPALSWFVAMLYSPAIDITAIYATSAFWAYFFSMLLLSQPLSRVTVGSIGMAFAGVVVLSLDGMGGEGEDAGPTRGRAFGDMIMMIGAILLGLYEVVYKMVLPESQGGAEGSVPRTNGFAAYTALPQHVSDTDYPLDPTPPISGSSTPLPGQEISRPEHGSGLAQHAPRYPLGVGTGAKRSNTIPLAPTTHAGLGSHPDRSVSRTPLLDSAPICTRPTHSASASAQSLPPALHANFLTSCIGVATFILGLPPIFALHWAGWETFRWPAGEGISTMGMWGIMGVVAWAGAFYNAGLMILIGIWGPTTSSVANLLTIGLVAVIDAVLMGLLPSVQTLTGVGMICIGFGILIWEGE